MFFNGVSTQFIAEKKIYEVTANQLCGLKNILKRKSSVKIP